MSRGIAPELLLRQVENTAPFLASLPPVPYVERLRAFRASPAHLDHFEYFALCLAAHYTSVACFVPTDVDNQIRHKLWDNPAANAATTEKMALHALESLQWDFTPVTARGARAPSGEWMSGHQGEWFSVITGAYSACRRKNLPLAETILKTITGEVEREEKIYADFRAASDGIGMLSASTILAHNLGDLDRVMDMWDLPESDPLRKFYNRGETQEYGELNKRFMAAENHRHFALREPHCLRRSVDFLLPLGPFFDAWGAKLARHPELPAEDLPPVVRALVDGFQRLNGKNQVLGYARALAGLVNAFPGGLNALSKYLPASVEKQLRQGEIWRQLQLGEAAFRAQWNKKALSFRDSPLVKKGP